MKPRRLILATLVTLGLLLWPLLAWAADRCAPGGGGDRTRAPSSATWRRVPSSRSARATCWAATSLTPCVYPMIAITVSVFGAKEAKSRWQGALLSLAFVLGHRVPVHADGRRLGDDGQGLRLGARQPVGGRRHRAGLPGARGLSLRGVRARAAREPQQPILERRRHGVPRARSCSASSAAWSRRPAWARSSSGCSGGSRRRATSRSARRRWPSTASGSGRCSSSSAPSP